MSLSLARTAVSGVSRSLRIGAQALPRTGRLAPSSLLTLSGSSRSFSKKKKSHDKDHDPVKVNTDTLVPGSERISAGDVYYKAEDGMKATVEKYRKDLAGLDARASGRVTPDMLAPVRVTLAGHDNKVKLDEVATVGVREGTTLIVTVFEDHTLKAVEQAIYDAKIPGVIPQRVDQRTIKIPIPKPTVEARQQLATTAQRHAEDARVHIRKHHQTAVKKGGFKKHSDAMDELQELCDKYVGEVDKILAEAKKKAK